MAMQGFHEGDDDDVLLWSEEGQPEETSGGGLCVPQDRLDDLNFFPDFQDDFISVANLLSSPEQSEVLDHDGDEDSRESFTASSGEGRKRAAWMDGWDCETAAANRAVKRARAKRDEEEKKNKKCSHCDAEETPQWRRGPMGPNTLCNACGVRYKSGRLVPEYRPFASPTFDSSKHSNFHRRIVHKVQHHHH
ncbi:unnamed protein product [Cuscuta campestris]|uniref:GATA-type domain-containing protein n=1 Tax=Cuscuta campestris TaxID=132261 RepID=A0A484NJ35_9ASTE|nr:unnamed protein product [Cuscuta campestris]